jgi:hypothetical protein
MIMEIKSYVSLEGNKVERLMPTDGSSDKFFGVAQAVNNGTPFEVRFPIEASSVEGAMKEFDNALSAFIKTVEAARAQSSNKNATSADTPSPDQAPKLVLSEG